MLSSKSKLPVRFWIESALAAVTGLLALLTAMWRDWLEVFGIAPDYHSGSTEWLIVIGLLVVAVVLGGLARADWRRIVAMTAPHPDRAG